MAVVLDLYAQKEVGCSMKPALGDELALGLLLIAVWDHKLKTKVILHLDQRSQGGFSRSSQHRIVEQVLDSYSETQRVFFNRVFFGGLCSVHGVRLGSLEYSNGAGRYLWGSTGTEDHLYSHLCRVAKCYEGQRRRPLLWTR